MKIVHIAPFGPHCAGLYEAARDMARADVEQGHDVSFVDAGALPLGSSVRNTPQIGAVDDRAGFRLVTEDPSVCNEADVILHHTGCPDGWLVWCQAPLIMVVHGTPLASFRVEQRGPMQSYSVYIKGASFPRVKVMLYFWPEFRPYWDMVFPPEKSVVFDYPPIDRQRFNEKVEPKPIPRYQRGRFNGLICDSWRDDSDIWEIIHGAIEASRRVQGLTWHIYAANEPLGPYSHLIGKLRSMGALGAIGGRTPEIEQLYRGFDFVLSGRRSVSRIIAESLCCGTPVIADKDCTAANYTADKNDLHEIAGAVEALVERIDCNDVSLNAETAALADRFDLGRYGRAISEVYNQIV